MKKIALVLLFVVIVSSLAFAEAPEDRLGELESKVLAISSKDAVATFVAKMFGPIYIVIALGMFARKESLSRIMEDFCKNSALLFYGGMFALVVGLAIILTHNVWVANWTVIITIIGWGGFIKGIWIIAFPGSVVRLAQAYAENSALGKFHLGLAFVFGVILSYFGYFS